MNVSAAGGGEDHAYSHTEYHVDTGTCTWCMYMGQVDGYKTDHENPKGRLAPHARERCKYSPEPAGGK